MSSPNLGWNGASAQRGTRSKAPRGRHADCARRGHQGLTEIPTEVGQTGQPGPSRRADSFLGLAAEDGTPAGTGRLAGGKGDYCKTSAKTRDSSLRGAGATACLRAWSTDSFHVISEAEFVGIRRRVMRIEEYVVVGRPCCDAVNADTRHAYTSVPEEVIR